MIDELIFIPKAVSFIIIILLVLMGIKELRQGHIGRLGIVANAFLLWQIFYEDWAMLPDGFQWYLNLGTIFAIIAIPSYLLKVSLPKEFYQIAFIGYGSLSLIIAIVIYVSYLA